jgi:hypothetical protein
MESLMGLAFRSEDCRPRSGPRDPALRKARICYDHLAGESGVLVYEEILRQDVLKQQRKGVWLTEHGRLWFRRLGIDTDAVASSKRAFCRACLVWSDRRHHLAGGLGAALLARILELGRAGRVTESRAIVFSDRGEKSLRAMLASASAPSEGVQQDAVIDAAELRS